MINNIKALISVMLIVCVLMTLASCEKSNTDTLSGTESETTGVSTSTTIPTDDTGSMSESETTAIDTSTTTSADDTNSTDESLSDKPFTLANPNTVLLDSNGVKMTALDFSKQTSEDYVTIDVQVENNNNHDVYIMLNSLTVNGYLISGKLDSLVTKASTNETVPFTISKRDIEFAEIDEIREVIVSFYANDADFDLFISPTDPVSLKTDKFDTPAQELNTSGVQVYNDNDILIVVKEELCSDSRYMLAKLLIKNSTDSQISVSCTKLLVNGKEITNYNCIRYGRVPGGIISYNSMDMKRVNLKSLEYKKLRL